MQKSPKSGCCLTPKMKTLKITSHRKIANSGCLVFIHFFHFIFQTNYAFSLGNETKKNIHTFFFNHHWTNWFFIFVIKKIAGLYSSKKGEKKKKIAVHNIILLSSCVISSTFLNGEDTNGSVGHIRSRAQKPDPLLAQVHWHIGPTPLNSAPSSQQHATSYLKRRGTDSLAHVGSGRRTRGS